MLFRSRCAEPHVGSAHRRPALGPGPNCAGNPARSRRLLMKLFRLSPDGLFGDQRVLEVSVPIREAAPLLLTFVGVHPHLSCSALIAMDSRTVPQMRRLIRRWLQHVPSIRDVRALADARRPRLCATHATQSVACMHRHESCRFVQSACDLRVLPGRMGLLTH